MKEEQVLNALSGLTNGALNYYQASQTVLVRDKLIRDYIENLQSQLKEKEEVIKEVKSVIKNNCIVLDNSYIEVVCTGDYLLEILSKGENK